MAAEGSLSGEVMRAWRTGGFGASLARQIAAGAGEERALIYAALSAVLLFVAQVPGIAQGVAANPDPDVTLAAVLGIRLGVAVFFVPLMLYGLAALAHLLAMAAGAPRAFLPARLALFWALVCTTPLILFLGAMAHVLPALAPWTGLALYLVFGWIWADTLRVAENFQSRWKVFVVIAIPGVMVWLAAAMPGSAA